MLSCVIGAVIYYFFPLKLSRFNLCRRILPSVRIDGGFYSIRSLRSLRHSILSRSFLHFERLHFIISRDYTSSFREITLHCYEILHFIVTRYYTSLLSEITLHHYERFHFIVVRDFTSSLRDISNEILRNEESETKLTKENLDKLDWVPFLTDFTGCDLSSTKFKRSFLHEVWK